MNKVFTFIAVLFFITLIHIKTVAQDKSFSLEGGIVNSSVPIYTTQPLSRVSSKQPMRNLSFVASYSQMLTKKYSLKTELSFKVEGVTTLNKFLDQEGFFIHSASLNYFSLGLLPQTEICFRKIDIAFNAGFSLSYLVKANLANYEIVNSILSDVVGERRDFRKVDFGLIGLVSIKRVIANELKLILSLRQYQGLRSVLADEPDRKVHMSNSIVSLGVECPLK